MISQLYVPEDEENTNETEIKEEESKPPPLPAPELNTTIYVKNINFNTTEDVLRKVIEGRKVG